VTLLNRQRRPGAHVDPTEARSDFRPEVVSHRNTGPVTAPLRFTVTVLYSSWLGRRTQALSTLSFLRASSRYLFGHNAKPCHRFC
jgi:hypothetical protein